MPHPPAVPPLRTFLVAHSCLILSLVHVLPGLAGDPGDGFAVVESTNFRVFAPSAAMAEIVAERAERQRSVVVRDWLDGELPDWSTRCTIRVHADEHGNRGSTTYEIARGEVRALDIALHGEAAAVLETVLPHEVVHAVVVSGLGRRPPRWADEGIAMTAEPAPVRERQRRLVAEIAAGPQGLRIEDLFVADDYPPSRTELLGFYARSYGVTAFLVGRHGTESFLRFVEQGRDGNWTDAARECLGYRNLAALESACASWLRDASTDDPTTKLASVTE